jgi:hypothetical protein
LRRETPGDFDTTHSNKGSYTARARASFIKALDLFSFTLVIWSWVMVSGCVPYSREEDRQTI